ncbi:MAG: hypothetical protein QM817_10320 [Archangium sp.]
MWGRTDSSLYQVAARRLLNFVVNPQGNAVSRPGTRLAWDAKLPDVALLPFFHASGESYVLELGNLYCRVYNGRTLALVGEVVTPFQTVDLRELQWVQFGSTMMLTHRLRPAQELTITSTVSINAARFAPPGDTPGAAPLQAFAPSIAGNPESMPVLVAWNVANSMFSPAIPDHPPRKWRYKWSVLMQHKVTGEVAESLPRDITQYVVGLVASGTVPSTPGVAIDNPTDELVVYRDSPVYIEPGLGAAVPPPSNWVAIQNLFYRGRGDLFGFVGRCAPNERFADFGDDPDYTLPPLRGDSPFKAGEYPAAVAFFQQRRCFAGPTQGFWMSALDEYANHDKPVINWSGQPLSATLLDQFRERGVSMAASDFLLVFTDTNVWCVGRSQVPLDYDTFAAVTRPIYSVGASSLTPLKFGKNVLFVGAQGRGVHALQFADGAFGGGEIAEHAEHLFRGAGQTPTATWLSSRIVSWCYQEEPFRTVWAVRSDGTLLSCTRTIDGRWAWSRHDTGNDKVLSVTAVPRNELAGGLGGFTDVFIAVVRGGVTRIERMTPADVRGLPLYADDEGYNGNAIGSEQLSYPVDAHVIATVTKATGSTISGLAHLEGRKVWASCPGIAPAGPYTVSGGSITTEAGWGPDDATTFKAAFGLSYFADLETLDAAGDRLAQKTVISVGFEVDNAQGLGAGQDFDHLEDWQQRDVDDEYGFPSAASVLAVVNVSGTYGRTGRAVLRQTLPLPVTVLGISREIDVGGR